MAKESSLKTPIGITVKSAGGIKLKPLTRNKVFRKKFVGNELTGAMNGFFNTVSMNENSITSMIITAIKPAKVGTDVMYYTPPAKDKTKVHLQAVYRFERTINLIEKLEEKGLLVKTADVKSALGLLKKRIKERRDKAEKLDKTEYAVIYYDVLKEIDKCLPAFKLKPKQCTR